MKGIRKPFLRPLQLVPADGSLAKENWREVGFILSWINYKHPSSLKKYLDSWRFCELGLPQMSTSIAVMPRVFIEFPIFLPQHHKHTWKQLKAAKKHVRSFAWTFLLCKWFIPVFGHFFLWKRRVLLLASHLLITADEVHIKGENKNHSWTLKAIQQQCLP